LSIQITHYHFNLLYLSTWLAQAFAAALESRKITAGVRLVPNKGGLDASAACGQLRNEFQKSPLVMSSDSLQSEKVAVACWCLEGSGWLLL
jgi:23S rRNA (adenine2503-C2)-methyltransferase